jgi:2-amino-4-hydroxy-6-hydroxymethyldihydropteridine diphosphokinase
MSVFIATGTNLGDRLQNLSKVKEILSSKFSFIAESRVYESAAVDYENQPDFFNQVLEFHTPNISPDDCMRFLLETEKILGRTRVIPKGPRLIDIDILFWDKLEISTEITQIPHPRLFTRSFVVLPLSELPGFKVLQEKFSFTFSFPNSATPLIIN